MLYLEETAHHAENRLAGAPPPITIRLTSRDDRQDRPHICGLQVIGGHDLITSWAGYRISSAIESSRLLMEENPHKSPSTDSRMPMKASPRGWMIVRLMCAAAFPASMVFEWRRWPDGSPLLGPLGIIWYNGIDGESIVLCAISLVMVFAFLMKPHMVTAVISLLGAMNWLFWGVMALGIGC